MATRGSTNIQQRGAKFQLRVKHPDMPRDRFFTFDDEPGATGYKATVDAWFAQGIVPPELLTTDKLARTPLVIEAIRAYERGTEPPPTKSDIDLLPQIVEETVGLRISDITFQWATDYVKRLKARKDKPTPGTIRKRVGLLGRVLDHYFRSIHSSDEAIPANVLRMLPKGYSLYPDHERVDKSRDTRLTPADELSIVDALDGVKREDKERPWGNGGPPDKDFKLLFETIVDTGLRLREVYWARVGHLDVPGRFLRVQGSKGHRGMIKPRTVPLKKELFEKLRAYCEGRKADDIMFPFWDGTEKDLKACSGRLSQRFRTLFAYAQVADFTEHDLRHEACCRWVTLKDSGGRWMFTDGEICRIMGWSDTKLLLRYMSLRGEDLSARLH